MHIRELSGCDLPDDFWPESGVPDCIVKKISKESGVAEKHVRACLLYAKYCNYVTVGELLGKHQTTISNSALREVARNSAAALREVARNWRGLRRQGS